MKEFLLCLSVLLCLIPVLASCERVSTVFECVTVSHSCPSLVWKSFYCVWVCYCVSFLSLPRVKEFLLCLSVLLCLIPVLASCERVSSVFECVTVSHSCPSLVWKSFYCVWVCYCVSFLSLPRVKEFLLCLSVLLCLIPVLASCERVSTVFECVTVSHSCPGLVWKSFYCVWVCYCVSFLSWPRVKEFHLCLSVLLCLIPVLASCERVSSVFECVTVSHSCPSLVWKSFICVWVCYCVSFLS